MSKQKEELRTTYTIKGRDFPIIIEFQYDLNGILKVFKIIEGAFTDKFKNWLFHPVRFPYKEATMNSWKGINNIEVIIGTPVIDFEAFYNTYNYKMGKLEAERAWKRLNKTEQYEAIKNIKAYEGYLKRKNIAKVYPATYLNKKRFQDNFNAY